MYNSSSSDIICIKISGFSRPEKIKSVTTLGSPLRGDPEKIVDPFVLLAAKMFINSLEPLNIPKAKNIFATNLARQFGEIQFYT